MATNLSNLTTGSLSNGTEIMILLNGKDEKSPYITFKKYATALMFNFIGMKFKSDVWVPLNTISTLSVQSDFPKGIVVANSKRVTEIYGQDTMIPFTQKTKEELNRKLSVMGRLVISQLVRVK